MGNRLWIFRVCKSMAVMTTFAHIRAKGSCASTLVPSSWSTTATTPFRPRTSRTAASCTPRWRRACGGIVDSTEVVEVDFVVVVVVVVVVVADLTEADAG